MIFSLNRGTDFLKILSIILRLLAKILTFLKVLLELTRLEMFVKLDLLYLRESLELSVIKSLMNSVFEYSGSDW
jgi:hypothetical protein